MEKLGSGFLIQFFHAGLDFWNHYFSLINRLCIVENMLVDFKHLIYMSCETVCENFVPCPVGWRLKTSILRGSDDR